MKNKRTKANSDTASQIPQGPWQAIFNLFWPLNSRWKKAFLAIIIVLAAFFSIWVSLPETTKKEFIDYLKNSKKAQSPAIVSHGNESTSPVGIGDGVASVRVMVLGSDKMPIDDAQVWTSVGGETKKVAGGWELEFPLSKLSENRQITVYATQRSAYLNGQREIIVNEGKPTAASIQLERETSAQVKGIVSDASGQPLADASVSILGSASSATTNAQGFFSLPANAAVEEDVRLRISKTGFETRDQYHPAGDSSAYIVLQRKKR